ncbi:MAG: DUF4426 domain-containing protein [Steroidobacteraceae bacterium]|nr:DUF4426 domain-containing protein [Steroidobacteraceae bacterium]
MTRVDGRRAAAAACAVLLLQSCGTGGAPPPALPYTDPGFVDAGGFRLHYALTQSTDLPSEIAGSYGIVRRSNLAVLTIALAARDGTRVAADGLEATSVSLTGLRQPIALARHDSASGPTWLATVGIRDREALTIEIRARPPASGPEIKARFTRTFHLE